MTTLKARATVTETGKFHLINRGRFEAELNLLKPGEYDLELKRRGRRSTPQNRYYWGVVIEEVRFGLLALGNVFDAETIHEFLKLRFNKKQLHDDAGTVFMEYGGSTSDMNKEQFSEYVDQIIQWAAEYLSVVIPPPDSSLKLFNE